MTILLLSFLIILLNPVADFAVNVSTYLHHRARLDLKVARKAESISQKINSIDKQNLLLKACYAECALVAVNPVALGALRAQARLLQMAQDALLSKIEFESFEVAEINKFNGAQRMPPGPCGLAGLLIWPTEPAKIYVFRREDAGFDLQKLSSSAPPQWSYANPKARVPWL